MAVNVLASAGLGVSRVCSNTELQTAPLYRQSIVWTAELPVHVIDGFSVNTTTKETHNSFSSLRQSSFEHVFISIIHSYSSKGRYTCLYTR